MARIRTFIAVDPGQAIRERLMSLQAQLAATGADVKWVDPNNLHFTLLFLGEVHERDLLDVCKAVSKAAGSLTSFNVSVEGPGCFPNMRRPRVLWVGLKDGREEMIALHDALEEPLLELRCYRRENREFTPHITLGRVQGEMPTFTLTDILAKEQAWKAGETMVREVHVMGSELTPQGPIYSVLSRGKLRAE
jgi:RNA 2',3'-cyclic 3'-phosphodiesterase